MATCNKCNKTPDDSYVLAKCDDCSSLLCSDCTSLSASEHRGITVKKRSPCITFRCTACVSKPKKSSPADNIQDFITRAIKLGSDDLKASFNKQFEVTLKKVDEQYLKVISHTKTIMKNTANMQIAATNRENTVESSELDLLKQAMDSLTAKYQSQQEELRYLRAELADLRQNVKTMTMENQPAKSSIQPKDVASTSQKKKPAVVGQKKTTDSKLVASTPQTSVFVSKISNDIGESDMMEYLKNNFGPDQKFNVEPVTVKSGQYKAYKVMANKNLEENLLNPNNWPENIMVKKFTFFRQNQPGNDNRYLHSGSSGRPTHTRSFNGNQSQYLPRR